MGKQGISESQVLTEMKGGAGDGEGLLAHEKMIKLLNNTE